MQANRLDAAHRFGFADDALDVLNLRDVHLAWFLLREEGAHFGREIPHLFAADVAVVRQPFEKLDVALHVMVEDGDIPARHIRDGDLVLVDG